MTSKSRQGAGAEGLAGDRAAAGARVVGAALRRAREERGLTLEEVGGAIRCAARQVRAVEEGRTRDLPPHPYARGLVTAYASIVGLDPEAAAQEWGRTPGETGGGRGSLFRVPLRPRSSWRDWEVPIACACAAAVMIALGPALGPAPVEIPDRPPANRAAVRPVPQPEAADQAAPQPDAPPADSNLRVHLRSEGATWIEVSTDGAAPLRQELRPGQNVELGARRRLGLTLGDAGAVRVSVDGRELGFIGDKGEVRRGIVFEAPGNAAPPGDAAPH